MDKRNDKRSVRVLS